MPQVPNAAAASTAELPAACGLQPPVACSRLWLAGVPLTSSVGVGGGAGAPHAGLPATLLAPLRGAAQSVWIVTIINVSLPVTVTHTELV